MTLAQQCARRLTIAGIGPNDPGLIQLRAWNAGAYGLPAPAPSSSGAPASTGQRSQPPDNPQLGQGSDDIQPSARHGQQPTRARCGRCEHAGHRGRCPSKYPSKCMPFPEGSGFICGPRQPCTCPWRTCRCGAPVAVASCAGEPEYEETIDRGSSGDPMATLAVRQLANGELEARPIAAGAELEPGEWRACDHDTRCPQAAARGVVDVTTSTGERAAYG
jgi:hypothetical protein